MADTDIELGVSLNPKDVKSRARGLQQEIQRVFDSVDTSKLDNKTKKTLSRMSELSSKSRQLQSTLQGMEEAFPQEVAENMQTAANEVNRLNELLKNSTTLTNEQKDAIRSNVAEWQSVLNTYQQYSNALQSGTSASEILHETNAQYQDTEIKLNHISNAIATLIPNTNNATSSMAQLLKQTNLLKIAGNTFDLLGGSIQRVSRKVFDLGLNLFKLPGAFSKVGGVAVSALGVVGGVIGRIVKTVGQITHALGVVWQKAKQVIGNIASKLLPIIQVGLQKVLSTIGRIGRGITSHFGNGLKSTNKLGIGVKQLFGTLLGFASLRAVFNKLKSAITEGIKSLAQWNNGNNSLNRSLSTLQASLQQLKNAMATAFTPILIAITPALNTLINLCTRAATAVGMLVAALTGSKTFVRAKKQQQDFAKSLGATGKAAGSAHDKLAAFDDLNVLGKDGSGGGGAGGGLSPQDMFEEVPIDTIVSDWADKLKAAWEAADFTEIGNIIGQKLRDALNNASDWLVDVAQPLAMKLGKSLATFLNGFFETEGLGTAVGRFFGELINTWLYFEKEFLDWFHGRSFGQFIGNAIMSALNTIDFQAAGHILAQKLNIFFDILGGIADTWDPEVVAKAVSDFVNTAISDIHWGENGISFSDFAIKMLRSIRRSLEEINWTELGEGIAEFINNIDWPTVATELAGSASALINGLLDCIIAAIEKTDWHKVGEGILKFLKEYDWAGLFTRLIEFIGAVIGGLGALVDVLIQAIQSLIATGIVKLIKWWRDKAYEDGKFTIQGLLEGILDVFKSIGTWIWEHIVEPFVKGIKEGFGIHSPSKVMFEIGVSIIQGLLNGITSLVDKIKQIWQNLKQNAIEIWTQVKNKLHEIVTTIKNNLTTIWTNIKETVIRLVTNLKERVVSLFTNLKNMVTQITNALKSFLTNAWNAIKNTITSIVTNIKNFVVTAWDNLKTNVINTTNNLKDTVLSVFEGLKNGIRNVINGILGFVEGLANGVVNGINTVTGALNNLHFDIPDWVPGLGGNSFGFNVPRLSHVSIPKLAQGAVIPPNKAFLAMLGDQRQGTNVEAPLDTIVDAFREVVGNMEVHNSGYSEMTLDGQTFARLVTPYIVSELKREGFNVSVMEG